MMKSILTVWLFFAMIAIVDAQPRTRYFNLASDNTVNVGSGSDTTSITVTILDTADAVYVWFAFPNIGRSVAEGKAMVKVTPNSAMTLKVGAYPCVASYNGTTEVITLTAQNIFSAAWGADSLEVLDVASGVALTSGEPYYLPIKGRASGDDLPWGPCDGLKISFVKTDDDNVSETITLQVIGQ